MKQIIDLLWSVGYLARRELWRSRGETAYLEAVNRETRRWLSVEAV